MYGRSFLGLALLACAACAVSSEDLAEQSPALTGQAPRTFARDFTFGSAIAGFQVDMGCPTVAAADCEDRGSDWYQWITTRRVVDNPLLFMSGDAPSSGPGFYELYEGDLDRAAGELSNDAIRLSIEWSRIFPRPTWGIEGQDALRAVASPDGLAFYHRLFAAMRRRGLSPFVTANHYTLPLWVHDGNLCNRSLDDCIAQGKGGWADPDRSRIVSEIAKYAGFIAEEFGGEVDRWATLNEPFSAVVIPGYLVSSPMRSNPPGLSGPWMRVDGAKTAATAMIEAHARMYDAIKAHDKVDADGDGSAAEVGIVYAFSDIVPKGGGALGQGGDDDRARAEHAQYFFHDMFMDGVVFGRVDEQWDAGPNGAAVRPDIEGRVDFIGVNYYFEFEARGGWIPASWMSFVSPLLDFDLLASFDPKPDGLKTVLRRVADRYHKPIYVTETGRLQDDPAEGAAWVVRTLASVHDAMREGADVRGYFAWTLMDNYEWNSGMARSRMGLYAVDPTTKARSLREGGGVYGGIARSRELPRSLEDRYSGYFR